MTVLRALIDRDIFSQALTGDDESYHRLALGHLSRWGKR